MRMRTMSPVTAIALKSIRIEPDLVRLDYIGSCGLEP